MNTNPPPQSNPRVVCRRTTLRVLMMALLPLLNPVGLRAMDIVWTNQSDGNWNVAANWSPNTVPNDATHVAIITNAGTYSVTNNKAARILGGLMLGGPSGTQTVVQATYNITLNGPGVIGANGRYNLIGGNFTGSNQVSVSGEFNWTGGGLASDTNTVIVVNAGGRFNLSGTTGKFFEGTITNAGTFLWSGSGQFNQYGVFHNLPGGVLETQTNAVMNTSGDSLLINEGTLLKSDGAGNTDIEPAMINSGVCETRTGALRFTGNSKSFSTGTRFTGAGSNVLTALTTGQSLRLEGTVVSENLFWTGGSLAGNGVLAGEMQWTSGTLMTNATLTVTDGSRLWLNGGNTKTVNGGLTNAGRILWDGTGGLDHAGVIHNLASGVFEVRNNATLNHTLSGARFINDGRLFKSAGTGITDLETEFVHNGIAEAQTGTLQFSYQPKTFNAGCQFLGAGTNLLISGTVTLTGAMQSENLCVDGATITGNGAITGAASWAAGTLASNATLTVLSGGSLQFNSTGVKTLNGSLTNAGQIVWSDAASITHNGLIHNLPGATFELRNDQTLNHALAGSLFINDGRLLKSAGGGISDLETAFVNNGTVEAQTGTIQFSYQPKTFNAGCRFLGAGRSTLSDGTVTLNGGIESENLVLSGATITGAGGVSGSFTWTSGILSPDVSFNVSPTGLLLLASSNAKNINGSITNAGTVIWTNTGNLTVRGAIHNLPGGVFEMQNNAILDWVSGSPVFVNEGLVRKSASTGMSQCQIAFVNRGTVDAQTGTIRFYDKTKTFENGCRFTGAGTNLLDSGTNTLNGTIESQNLVLDGASVSGAGSVTGSFIWNNGTLTPDVSFFVTPGGLLQLASSGAKILNGTITNAGTVLWTNTGNLTVRGAIHNLPGGVFEIRNNAILDWVSGSPVFVNEGTFRKSVGTLVTTCQIPFQNRGRVEVNTGTINFTAPGSFTDLGGTIALAGGTFQTPHPMNLIGALNGFGTVRPFTGGTAALTNNGLISPSPAGTLRIEGNLLQSLAGTLEFALAGTSPGTNHSLLNITGAATFAGTLGVTRAEGYLPAPGDTFNVLTSRSRAGDFACFNGLLLLGENRRLLTQWGATNLALVTVAAPDPTNVTAAISAQYPSALVCWPAEFTGWRLLANTNVGSTNWIMVPGVTNRLLETPMTSGKYFRVQKP